LKQNRDTPKKKQFVHILVQTHIFGLELQILITKMMMN